MTIHGFQKLTLLDYPGHTACTVFTGGCNFRCPFCHNAGLVLAPNEYGTYGTDEVLAYLEKRRGVIDGICITGGEPLLDPSIGEFAGRVKKLGFLVKLDTNGSFPDRLRSLIERGLVDRVAMDVKNCLERYGETVGIDGFDTAPIEESAELLKRGYVSFEFRTTVVRELHGRAELEKLGEWLGNVPEYYLQAFSDKGGNLVDGLHGYTEEEYRELLEAVKKYVPSVALRGA